MVASDLVLENYTMQEDMQQDNAGNGDCNEDEDAPEVVTVYV